VHVNECRILPYLRKLGVPGAIRTRWNPSREINEFPRVPAPIIKVYRAHGLRRSRVRAHQCNGVHVSVLVPIRTHHGIYGHALGCVSLAGTQGKRSRVCRQLLAGNQWRFLCRAALRPSNLESTFCTGRRAVDYERRKRMLAPAPVTSGVRQAKPRGEPPSPVAESTHEARPYSLDLANATPSTTLLRRRGQALSEDWPIQQRTFVH